MKNLFSVFTFIFLFNYSFGQDVTTLLKLHEVSVAIGVANNISIDTMLIKSRMGKINYKVADQQSYLLRAAEYYSIKDYENSSYNIRKVVLRFKNNDYNNLKYLVLIGSYANLKDIKVTAKYFYLANKTKLISPENMNIITREIRNNFKKGDFDEALSHYYYYHARLKIIDEIKFDG